MAIMSARGWSLAGAVVCVMLISVSAQISKPVASNEHIEPNKFRTRDIIDVENMVWGTDASDFIANSKCPHRIYQNWATEVEASVYSTPVIVDVASDGVKDVVIPTFIKHVEVLDGPHGHRAAGFPFTFPNSAFYASPMIYDINYDGSPDIGVTTFNGEIVWLTEYGMPIFGKSVKIPHLKVKKFWYKGLKADPQDMAHTGATQFEIERMGGEDKDPLRASRGDSNPTFERPFDYMNVAEEQDAYGLATQLMASADTDGSQKVSADEFSSHARVDDPAMSQSEIEAIFSAIDEDRSGDLDLQELIKHMDDLDQNDSENVFNLADSDDDGVLSKDEFVAHARLVHSGKSDGELEAYFNDADENRDGIVTLEEAKGHWTRFDVELGKGSKDESRQSKAERVREQGVSREEVKARASEQLKNQMLKDSGQAAEPASAPPPAQPAANPPPAPPAPPPPPPPPPPPKKSPPPPPNPQAAKQAAGEAEPQGEGGQASAELVKAASKVGLKDLLPKLQEMGVQELSDLQFLGEEEVAALALPKIKATKLKNLIQHHTPKKPTRRLMGGAALDDVEVDGAADESGEIAEGDAMPLGEMEGEDGGLLESDGDDALPDAPRDGEELIDGEPFNYDYESDGWGSDWDYYDDDYGYGYHDYRAPSDDEVATKLAQEKYEAKVKSWQEQPLSAPGDSQWSTMKGYFAPQLDEEAADAEVRSSHFKAHVLGHDEVFTRLMSVDRHVLLKEALRRNSSQPMPGDRPKEDGHVFVDPHCLSTPIIADLDADGRDEIIAAVSYYFDKDQYSDPSAFEDLDIDVKVNKYVAGGLVAMDVQTGAVKFQVHLDLTTDETVYRAYLYSSPTVADLDADGKLEVILGTSLGFIYVVDHKGDVRPNFPITMAEIQGQVGVADVNNDGQLELVAVDNRYNVAAFSSKGKELWEKRISGYSAQGPTLGDVDGDGVVDVVVATTNGHLWALNGKNGEVLKNFPVKAGGAFMAPPLILKFPTGVGKSVVVPAHDGFLYIVDGVSGCAHKIDIGENSYSMVLAEDLNGNGKMDLLVSTMNGNVISFGTEIAYEPLKTWSSREQGNNNVEVRDGRQGIYVLDQYRHHHDNSGATMMVGFEIVDTRPIKGFGGAGGSYAVRMSAGGSVTLFQKTYSRPGQYLEEVPCPAKRQYSTIFVEMKNELGQHFEDQVAMSFNMHFYRALKWVLITPFIGMSGALFFVKDMQHVLPL